MVPCTFIVLFETNVLFIVVVIGQRAGSCTNNCSSGQMHGRFTQRQAEKSQVHWSMWTNAWHCVVEI